jgi:hypothetical protein
MKYGRKSKGDRQRELRQQIKALVIKDENSQSEHYLKFMKCTDAAGCI